ncbi:putative C2 domain, von Willebrand factor, type A, copine, protein BONZAI [Rosa chinensis]|uniref:Putative C2 domain, von Willebrand factor, type A, copine, protein BONZAI n=1 Tax=Rosa chinensis TaxID=74649 RepID=A0A2P6R6K4_ROSCH|nr:putative C2 domain, von Willebrand factor, type A, copine, protein BONZAI [Rosa chinensis]
MGGCFSDVKGGKQAVGGARHQQQRPINSDAVELFNRSRGVYPLYTPLELSLSSTNLLDRDITSKSDPMVVVYVKRGDGKLEELGRTEVILNSLNPAWIEKITVSYQFEVVQPLIFHVYDVDTKYHNVNVKTLKLEDQEFLGEGSCVLSEIVTKQSRSLTLNLHSRSGRGGLRDFGTLTVHAEETMASKSVVEIKFRCSQLENKDVFSKSDPFLRVSRIVESGGSVPICKTEVVDNNLNPIWKPLSLSMQQFGSKDLKGQLFVDQFNEKQQFSFLDYISSGFELNFMVAVDFTGKQCVVFSNCLSFPMCLHALILNFLTASNGNPHQHDSLHYIDPYGRLNSYQQVSNCDLCLRNEITLGGFFCEYFSGMVYKCNQVYYLQAITEVGEVIQFYDADKRFPAWGFGGRTAGGPVSHCFNLDGTATGFEVEGVQGIMTAYASALHNVSLSGPTLFGPVVNGAAEIAGNSLFHNNNKYYVLMIITDGILTDLQETTDAFVRASDLPLSVLIVGVGSADFKQMEILDADNGLRLSSSTGRVATRDIVQFVPMREVQSGRISAVQSLLEELPGQFLSYMRCRDVMPLTVHAAQSSAPQL